VIGLNQAPQLVAHNQNAGLAQDKSASRELFYFHIVSSQSRSLGRSNNFGVAGGVIIMMESESQGSMILTFDVDQGGLTNHHSVTG
jgi:hypothetical protein